NPQQYPTNPERVQPPPVRASFPGQLGGSSVHFRRGAVRPKPPLDMLADVTSGLSQWWAPALAFAAGVVSFASPCVLPLVPGYLSFVSGGDVEERRPLV